MFKSTSTSLILLGVLAIIVGIIAIAWPGATVLALVILFAVYAFIDAGLQAMRAFSSRTAGPVAGHLLLGLVDLAAGAIALIWPAPTALVLVLIVAIWAFTGGFFEIFAAFRSGETAGTRALFIVGGLVSIAFGVVLFSRPDVGAVTLALLFGLFSLIYGSSQIAMGVEARRTGRTCTRFWRTRPDLVRGRAPAEAAARRAPARSLPRPGRCLLGSDPEPASSTEASR